MIELLGYVLELLGNILEIVLWGVLIIIIAQHVLGPVLVWRNERVPVSYEFPPLEVSSFLDRQTPAVHDGAAQLQALGFVPAAASVLERPNMKTSFLLFRHGTDPASAMLVVISHAKGSLLYTEFTQRFSDNTFLDVMSSTSPSIYPEDARKLLYRFPRLPIPELYVAFTRLRAGLQPHKAPTQTLAVGSELADLARWMNLETTSLVERGYFTPTDGGQVRLTPKGACLFTWRLVWPWKPLLNSIELARARRALAAT